MHINAIDFLNGGLNKIEDKIKHLENSPNRAFILIESDTLGLFHWFNLCFKHFWKEEFDRKSASQLLLYQKFIQTHSELSGRYSSLFQEQIDYLKNVLTIDKKSSKDLNPVFFGEEKNKDLIDYYETQLKHELDIEGNPLYVIDVNKNAYFEDNEKGSQPFDFYTFRSDSINNTHYKGLLGLYYCLKSIFNLMSVVCSYPEELISGYKPSQEEIITALENESRQYARENDESVERELRKIAQIKKTSRNTPLSPDIWGKVMEEEDDIFELAISEGFDEKEEKRLEHIFATKEQLVDNFSLLQKIKDTCFDEELFDIRLSVETHNLLLSLNADNLELFYELILRRNIIHREMFPELKTQYDEWLNRVNKQPEENTPEEELHNLKDKLNYNAPKIHLQRLLQQSWFTELRSDEKYDSTWTDSFIEALMASEYGKGIAHDWAVTGARDKKNQLKAYIVGLLKDASVLKGSYIEIGNKTGLNNQQRTFSSYMARGKKQPYAEWVKEYVAGQN